MRAGNMRASLSAPGRVDELGRSIGAYAWAGGEEEAYDSALAALLAIELFADPDLDGRQKAELLPAMVLPDPGAALARCGADRFWEMLSDVVWEAYGLDITGARNDCRISEARAFDWSEDARRISASLRMAYGFDWAAEAGSTPFSEVCGMLGGLLEDGAGETPFAQAVRYRLGKPPERTGRNDERVRAWNAARDHFALERGSGGEAGTAEREARAADMFASLRRAASHG